MQFVGAMRDIFALMGAALSILHPRQYEIGIAAWKAMAEDVALKADDGYCELTAKAGRGSTQMGTCTRNAGTCCHFWHT
jgi:hypothetical protein